LQEKIYQITKEIVQNKHYLDSLIYQNNNQNYYWSDDFSEEFYISLAKAGFISVSHQAEDQLYLLPEIQFEYALLDFEDLHISKKVKKLLQTDRYVFSKNSSFIGVLDSIEKHHEHNWIKGKYKELLVSLYEKNNLRDDFKVLSFELFCPKTEGLGAGEVGYSTGGVYTSLSGFCLRDKNYNNFWTLQMVLLAKYLQQNGYAFWNLGHPHMEYKKKLGAKIYSRSDFLKRFINKI
jgi:Leu/Phe-tRNA-protein transferase